MDVGELLSKALSHKADKSSSNNPSIKRKSDAAYENGDYDKRRREEPKGITDEEREKILEMLDNEPETEALDETNLKKMLLNFEKRVYKNQEQRIKYPDLPEKFMDSEIEVNEIIQQMHVIATAPDLYHILVDLNTVQSLLQFEEGATAVVDSLLEKQVVAILVQNLERLDENNKEEADGVHNTLSIIENVTEFRPECCTEAAQQGLMVWLLKRIKAKMPFDANKLYASEILAIILQNSDENRLLIGEYDGIDVLLQQLASYKRNDPSNKEELEYMENLFDAMCSCLMRTENRAKFLRGEGLQLMNLMLREKKLSRNSAIKVLNHAMSGAEGADNSQKFVDILGLRTIFPLFMKTPKQAKAGPSSEELEEHITSIVASMMKNCQATQRQRLVNKYTENDHEKVKCLSNICRKIARTPFKYLDKVRTVDDQIEREKQRMKNRGEEIEDDDEFYIRRLEAGLFTLQLVDYIMLEICATGPSSVKQRVMQILNMRGGSIKSIRSIMREYAGNIGDAKDPEAKEEEQERILQLVDKF
ncbi:CTNNBL1 [Mytilus coruscus]|uniref:Beta-catenin-like protein 1 n=1 Tax=Mytilus coruscus TaxID=42192 RepID=A0A6J8CP47_MYTCO|nr:CTNNBL1 [Mytilus coruscus]